MDSGLHNSIFL